MISSAAGFSHKSRLSSFVSHRAHHPRRPSGPFVPPAPACLIRQAPIEICAHTHSHLHTPYSSPHSPTLPTQPRHTTTGHHPSGARTPLLYSFHLAPTCQSSPAQHTRPGRARPNSRD
ncbi:hypothetical protein BC834DRAFT_869693, partial [Gloeopeniophorella convolvens]